MTSLQLIEMEQQMKYPSNICSELEDIMTYQIMLDLICQKKKKSHSKLNLSSKLLSESPCRHQSSTMMNPESCFII